VRVRFVAVAVGCCALMVGLSACGGKGGGGKKVSGNTLTIFSSLPLQGASQQQSQAVINGERLALDKLAPGGKLGKFKIKYVSLDDSTAQNPGTADEGQTAQNARKAVSDKTTIFYLGEYNSGGSKVSIPILNKGGIPQISPANTAVGLTTNEQGAAPGEPAKYYPTGKRTYARIVPRDTIQGAAVAATMKADGCKAVTIWNDGSVYGAGVANNTAGSSKKAGIKVEDQQRTDKTAPNYRALASGIKSDCFFWGGVTAENGVQVYKDAANACPKCKLYGPDGVTDPTFVDPKQGGIPASVGARIKITVATLGIKDLPRASQGGARSVLNSFKTKYHTANVPPYGIYGYETMALALDTLKKAGSDANDRSKVNDLVHTTHNRLSVLGTYSIDKNGDTSLTDYGLYVIKGGLLTYAKKLTVDPSLIS
jgi:branched-chain amino acid transport system substrate-binding protein